MAYFEVGMGLELFGRGWREGGCASRYNPTTPALGALLAESFFFRILGSSVGMKRNGMRGDGTEKGRYKRNGIASSLLVSLR